MFPCRFCPTGVQTATWLFLTCILSWKRISAISLHRGPSFSWNWNWNFFFFDIHCVTEASKFSLNHNLALESKQNSAEDPKRCKIHLFFYRNYKHYTKCVVIWCGAQATLSLEPVLQIVLPSLLRWLCWKWFPKHDSGAGNTSLLHLVVGYFAFSSSSSAFRFCFALLEAWLYAFYRINRQ